MRVLQAGNNPYSQVNNRTEFVNAVKAAKGDEGVKKEKSVSGEPRDTVTISKEAILSSKDNSAAAQADSAKTDAVSTITASSQTLNSVFDKLKQIFNTVNFVTGKDPFDAREARNNGRNTVYLDSAALRKLENDPRYAARVFAEIESSMATVGKGYSYREGDRTYTLQGSALNLSFYGQGESSKLVATMFVFDADGKPNTSSSLFSLLRSPGEAIHRGIAETANNSLKKWFDVFKVPESQRRYYDFAEGWKQLKTASRI